MKRIFLVIQLAAIFAIGVNASVFETVNDEQGDTIYRLGGRKLIVNIVKINANDIDYMFDGDPNTYSIETKQIQKICYKNGKVEEFNKPIFIAIDETSWEAVLVTEKAEDVAGLYKLGVIDAKSSPGAKNKKKAINSANIRLQKKAANMKGAMVLITHKEARGGYGEVPGYYMEAEVYGYEPPEVPEEELPDL